MTTGVSVGGHPDVELDRVRSGVDRGLERLDRVLGLLDDAPRCATTIGLHRPFDAHAWLAGHSGSTGHSGQFGFFAVQSARPWSISTYVKSNH